MTYSCPLNIKHQLLFRKKTEYGDKSTSNGSHFVSFFVEIIYHVLIIGSDNKFRILKNGGVHAVLVAMSAFPEDEGVNLNALKVLSNLLESGTMYLGIWRVQS